PHTRSKRDWSSDVCSSDLSSFIDIFSNVISSSSISSRFAIWVSRKDGASILPRSTLPNFANGKFNSFANFTCVYPFNFRKAFILLQIRLCYYFYHTSNTFLLL